MSYIYIIYEIETNPIKTRGRQEEEQKNSDGVRVLRFACICIYIYMIYLIMIIVMICIAIVAVYSVILYPPLERNMMRWYTYLTYANYKTVS